MGVQRHLQQLLDAVQEGKLRLGGGRLGHIVRYGRPQRHSRESRQECHLGQDTHNPHRALILRRFEVHALPERSVIRGRAHRNRAAVRNIRQQRAHQHHIVDIQRLGMDQQLRRIGPPFIGRLRPLHKDDVHIGVRCTGLVDPGGRPFDLPLTGSIPAHRGPRELKVVVLVCINGSDLLAAPQFVQVAQRIAGCFSGIVPPLKGGKHHSYALSVSHWLQEPFPLGSGTLFGGVSLEAIHFFTLRPRCLPAHGMKRRKSPETRPQQARSMAYSPRA
ncbi:hypothetical protein ARTHRO8AJ_240008 [Arthrobacter sp. 8AJ]|nr:hypothetical protein ARTHRO8AJ_240008 [Arthrobacter sp. 8AJ]